MSESEWRSHEPLLKTVMELYQPNFVLEIGVGNYSTPEFVMSNEYLGIENDKEWIKNIQSTFKNLNIINQDLGVDVKLGTKLNELSKEKVDEIISFYKNVKIPNCKPPKLLFVDQFTSCRTLSINTLGDKFDIVIYHDSQPEGISWYNYDLIDLKGFEVYHLKTNTSWTTMLIRPELNPERVIGFIQPYIEDFKRRFPDISYMKFEK